MLAFLWGVAVALTVWRWCVPVESAQRGGTLGVALAWCLTAAATAGLAAVCFVPRRHRRRRWLCAVRRADVGVAALVVGHVAGALWLVSSGAGDARAAINMAVEWLGIGAAWWTVRRLAVWYGPVVYLLRHAAVLIAVMAVLGIWQHWEWYDRIGGAYAAVRERLDRAIEEYGPSSSAARRLQAQLIEMGVPPEALQGRGRTLFELRIRDSREPLGFFALANTFAGLLVCGAFWCETLRSADGIDRSMGGAAGPG
ncbi:MAG: hypothetical protein D6725_06430, partial [Planctomycetota bacterium]